MQGQRVLLVDDLTTDGGSKVAFTRGLREAGAVVEDALTIFHHGVFPGSAERLAELGLRLHALAGWDEILRLAPDDGFSAEHSAAALNAISRRPGGVVRPPWGTHGLCDPVMRHAQTVCAAYISWRLR